MFGTEIVGALKFGALLGGGAGWWSSGTPNDIISTMLETSFAIFSGSACGSSFPTNFRLQRYIARANSGNRSCPDFVVSDSVHILIRSCPGSFDRINKSLTFSPSRACPSPTADLKSCSNFAWSVAVKYDNRIFGIFMPGLDACGALGWGGADEND